MSTTNRAFHLVSAQPAILVLAALLTLAPLGAAARINLDNFGGGGFHGTILDGGFGDPTVPPGGGGGGGGPSSVSDYEGLGYVCDAGHLSEIECHACGFETVSETQSCEVVLCANNGTCNERKRRYDIPAEVVPEDYGFWAKEFSWGASNYWIADFDGDGRRDLGAQQGSDVYVALSRGTYFEDVGKWTGPVPFESQAGTANLDVNGDGFVDALSVSGAGHLVAGISNGSGIIGTIDMPNVFCAQIGDCLIGDVNGDGYPDLVEVMRYATGTDRAGDVWVSLGSAIPGFPQRPDPPPATDTDGDGVADRDDICIDAADPDQLDSDGDGYGNACDADLDNDGVVGHSDLEIFAFCYLAGLPARPDCAPSDFDGDGVISLEDYYNVLVASTGNPPGPSSIDTAPAIELFTPADGAILNVSTSQAWVAGWVANVPTGDVEVFVNDVPVPLVGPDNYFSTFIDLAVPPTEQSLFHPVLVEALRGDLLGVERRVVLVGDKVRPGGRSHGALGARLTDEGLARIQEYLQDVVAEKVVAKAPEEINGYTYEYDCVELGGVVAVPICWSGYEISNAKITGVPVISVAFEGDQIHVHASLEQFSFDWEVDVDGPNCGDDTTVSNIEIDARYQLQLVPGGKIDVFSVQDPTVDADINVDGCWGGGHGKIESSVRSKLEGLVTDPDGDGYQVSPVQKAIRDVFRGLDVSGSLTLPVGDEQPPVFDPNSDGALTQANFRIATPAGFTTSGGATLLASQTSVGIDTTNIPTAVFDDPDTYTLGYDARFESLTQDSQGFTAWLGAGVDALPPVGGLGGPDGAFQIPFASVPALPNALASGDPYHVAAAITPNGLNEVLDALTRSGYLASQSITVDEIALGEGSDPIPLKAGILRTFVSAFKEAYPSTEPFSIVVSPSAIPPVVSGRRGPDGESLDVQIAQAKVDFVDSQGTVALGLRVDARIGVDVTLGTSDSGSLTALARNVELLDFAIVENPIGADPQEVANRILCEGDQSSALIPCAIAPILANGLDKLLAAVPLPSLRKKTDTEPGFDLAPKCLQRLDDGTLVAEFGLLLPGEVAPTGGHAFDHFSNACMAPLVIDGGDVTGGGGTTVGGHIGDIGNVGTGVLATTQVTPPPVVDPVRTGTVSTTLTTSAIRR